MFMGALGGGGSSKGALWNLGYTARVPLTGMVAHLGPNPAGCSLLGILLSFGCFSGALSNQDAHLHSSDDVQICKYNGRSGLMHFKNWHMIFCIPYLTCLVVKFSSIVPLIMLKKQSTSSVLAALGFSKGQSLLFLSRCRCSLPLISAVIATNVSTGWDVVTPTGNIG